MHNEGEEEKKKKKKKSIDSNDNDCARHFAFEIPSTRSRSLRFVALPPARPFVYLYSAAKSSRVQRLANAGVIAFDFDARAKEQRVFGWPATPIGRDAHFTF